MITKQVKQPQIGMIILLCKDVTKKGKKNVIIIGTLIAQHTQINLCDQNDGVIEKAISYNHKDAN